MSLIAIIGGTGLTSLKNLQITGREVHVSPFGEPSAPLTRGTIGGREVLFLPRHGQSHTIPPHRVNYRANIAILKAAGADKVIAVNAVGGISEAMQAQTLVVPDQLIDYTWSRKHTFFEEGQAVTHIDFTEPYCEELRQAIIRAASAADIDIVAKGTYGATQGPRLETAAEINRLDKDGCDVVGMTGMPEAALAREVELCYASIAVVANRAAGRGEGEITMESLQHHLSAGIDRVRGILESLIPNL